MNVLVTCHSYYPNNDGVQFVTQYLCEGLAKKGHVVTVVTNYYKNREMSNKETHNGVSIIRINAKTVHKIHTGDKNGYIKLIKQLVDQNDVMVNVCTQCATTDWLLSELKSIEIPKVLYMHSIWDFRYSKEDLSSIKKLISKMWGNIIWRPYYFFNKKNFKEYDIVTQLHEKDYTTDFFKKKYGIDSVIIENAAEDAFFDEAINDEIKLPKKYIINVSNFQKRKNQMKCLELFLNDNTPEGWSLILVGSRETDYSVAIENKYKEFKKRNPSSTKDVRMLYGVPRADISTYVKKASLYMMTSKWEAFPISLIECMAAEVPFISSNVGIVKYLSGGIVCKNDAEYLHWMRAFMTDDKLRKKYGELGGSEARERYTISNKTDKLENILIKIMERNNERNK